MKIERLYSNYQEEERLYSTGNDELDKLMERAFCEGYEYAQHEFSGRASKTGKTIQEIKQILKPTGKKSKKDAKNRWLEKVGEEIDYFVGPHNDRHAYMKYRARNKNQWVGDL